MYPLLIVLAVIAMDQIVKIMIVSKVMPIGEIVVIKHFFSLNYVENYGIAFGMFKNKTLFFIVTVFIIAIVISYLIFKLCKKHIYVTICLSMILGGAMGNQIDRIRLGYVVDYLSFSIFPPVFNLADSAVVVGAFLLGIIVLLDKDLSF